MIVARLSLALVVAALLGACRSTLELPLIGDAAEDGLPANVRIEGNEAVTDRALADAAALELETFAEKGRREADAEDAAWSMERHLQEQGYHDAKVEYALESGTAVFRIEEGHRALLSGVRLVGVKHLDREKLLEYFDFPGEQLLGLGPVVFDEQLLRDAAEQVEREYRLFGFQDVEVDGPEMEWNEDHSCGIAVFTVKEGPRICVCDVRFEGVRGCDMCLRGKPYNARIPAQAAGRIRSGLLARGHQFAKVRADVERPEGSNCAHITVRATPGPKVRLDCVRLKRLDRTSPRFVRTLIPMRKGQVLGQACIDECIENLYRAGLFKSANPEVVRTGPDTADLVFDLPEIEARSIEVGAGYGSYEKLRGDVRYVDRNLFGWGRRLEALGRGHTKGFEADALLIDPWIFGRMMQLELEAAIERRREPSYTFTGLRLRAAVRADLPDRWRIRGGYRFQSEKATDVQGEIPGAELDGFVNAAGLFIDVIRDKRDNAMLPTEGTFLEAGTFWSSPSLGGDLDYLEFTARGAYLIPLGDAVVAFGAAFRTKEILDGAATLPIQERFFLGGDQTVRSFEESELGPIDDQGDPLGGLTALSFNAEVRVPLVGAFHGAVFYDGGVVNADSFDFTGPYGHAIGAGVRYYFPFGPLRLDLGYNPGRLFAADDRWALHVSLGFNF